MDHRARRNGEGHLRFFFAYEEILYEGVAIVKSRGGLFSRGCVLGKLA
jgi:hypothetical protein